MALSLRGCSETEVDNGPVVRCARLAAALIAILAVRAALTTSGHATQLHIGAPCILVLVALGAGAMLREIGHGLACRLPRPRWSTKFAVIWAANSGLLLTVLLFGSSFGFAAWTTVALAVCLGLVLAASLPGARRLLWSLARRRRRTAVRTRAAAVPNPYALILSAPVPAPLLAGWSGRGPPLRLS